VRAYQTVEPLTIGELWAVAITLRIVLIENMRRLADQIIAAHEQRAADAWWTAADRGAGRRGRAARDGGPGRSPQALEADGAAARTSWPPGSPSGCAASTAETPPAAGCETGLHAAGH
jgi:cyclic beta-1,2-glucan synthetase